MIPLKNKKYFISSIIEKKFLLDLDIKSFLMGLLDRENLLNKVDFYNGEPLRPYKYKLYILFKNNLGKLYIDGEKINLVDPFYYVFLHEKEIKEGEMCFCIINIYDGVKNSLMDCCVNTYLQYNLLFNLEMDKLTKDIQKKRLYKEIDEALKNKNKEEFLKLSKLYNELD